MSKINVSSFFRSRSVKNAGWLIVGKIIQMFISLIVGVLTARYLGPGNYGLINYATAYTAFFSSFCTLGINSVIVKEFVDNPGGEGVIIGTTLGLRALSSILSAITVICISFVLDAGEPITQIVVALCSVGMIFHVFETFNYWFQYKLHSKITAVSSLVAYAVTALYRVVLLANNKPVEYFAFATSIDYVCLAILLGYFYFKENGGKLKFSWTYGKQLLNKSYHYLLAGLMVAVYGQTDKIMLKHMISDTENGYYSTAVSICNMWTFVLVAIIDSVVPVIMQAHKNNRENYMRANKILYSIVFYISAIVSLFFLFFGKWVVNLLYGEDYVPAVAPLRIITWYTAFSYLGVARNAWIVCENKQKYLKYIYISAAVSNVLLNIVFIPLYGATGAAIASLIAQVVTTLIAPFFSKDMRENSVMIVEAIFLRGIIKNKKHKG